MHQEEESWCLEIATPDDFELVINATQDIIAHVTEPTYWVSTLVFNCSKSKQQIENILRLKVYQCCNQKTTLSNGRCHYGYHRYKYIHGYRCKNGYRWLRMPFEIKSAS